MEAGTGRRLSALGRCVLIVAVIGLMLALPASALARPVRIMIDPGHGGKDDGARGGGLSEKTTNLEISKYVAQEAWRQGWKAALTRKNDRFIPLTQRPKKATAYHADVFVSIHSNDTGNKAMGVMTIYRTKPGWRLGADIMQQLAPLTPYGDIGNKHDVRGLAVLRAAKQPAVLVEVMSVSAAKERSQLRDPRERLKVAQAIVKGIAKFEGVPYKEPATDRPVDTKALSDAKAEAKATPVAAKPEAPAPKDSPDRPKQQPVAHAPSDAESRLESMTLPGTTEQGLLPVLFGSQSQ